MSITVSWFSAGISSAVATKMAIDSVGVDKIIYIHIDDQHPDSMRFLVDCQEWFGKEIEILQSPYKCVENAVFGVGGKGYVNGPAGASCTNLLKKRVRKEWEHNNKDKKINYIWGMDSDESNRADRINITMPEFTHMFPLIDARIGKRHAHEIATASGIVRPAMYELGYSNNNCLGCVKGGKGYWNKIRKEFPDIFRQRSEMERKVGHSCINGTFLDELDPDAGREEPMIIDDCGILCELIKI